MERKGVLGRKEIADEAVKIQKDYPHLSYEESIRRAEKIYEERKSPLGPES